MRKRLLIATDLDRTLIPNGPEPESPGARGLFARLAERPHVVLAYVSGRHRALVEEAIAGFDLPAPDFVIGDVGTSIYHVGAGCDWTQPTGWEKRIARDWGGCSHAELAGLLEDCGELQLQEAHKQNRCKLSYYLPMELAPGELDAKIRRRMAAAGIAVRLVWSIDEPAGVGLLDILPAGASKLHALEALMQQQRISSRQTIFCGDSGNDMEVLASAIPAVLVANSQPRVQAEALQQAEQSGNGSRLYIARGHFMGMNGNYSAGMLEGIVHFHPEVRSWLGAEA